MSITRDLRKAIESGKFDRVEDAWLARLEEPPLDLDELADLARSLAAAGQEEQTATLLELLDGELQDAGLWQERLRLLKLAGPLRYPGGETHSEILETLRRIHPDFPSLEGLIEKVGLHRATGNLAKSWEKVARLRALLAFESGTVVAMEGKGVGRVVEVNLELDSFKIEFADHADLRVGFAAAPKLLTPLPPGHFLRRKLEAPGALIALRKERPGELLGLLLSSAGGPLEAREIRQMVAGIVDEAGWTAWWAAARKHPQLVVRGKGRQKYGWAESGAEALDALREAFGRADPERRLELYLKNRERSPELERWMAERLIEHAAGAIAERPELALAVEATLERAGSVATPTWDLLEVATAVEQPAQRIATFGDRVLRERLLAKVRERRADWPAIFRSALELETDGKLLDTLFGALEADAPGDALGFLDDLLSQPRKNPVAFLWLAEGIAGNPLLADRNPLRLLQQIIATAHDASFNAHKARIRKLWDGGHSIPLLLSRLSADQAPRAFEAIHRAPVEEFLRVPLLNALKLRFPELDKDRKQEGFYATAEAIDARRRELKELLEVEIPANRKAIEEARELGDLRENFEYKSARQRHELLSAHATRLDRDLRRVRPIDPRRVDATEVRVGTDVVLDGVGETRRVTILGPWESQPEAGVYSYESEMAQQLLGSKVGDTVVFESEQVRVLSIAPFDSTARG